MTYHLSAAKLQAYHRCPQAYYFRYERGLKDPAMFGSSALGTALHKTLAKVYWNWNYTEPIPRLSWIEECWEDYQANLSPNQISEGTDILYRYYDHFIANQRSMRKPLAVEGKIKGSLQVDNLEFSLTGRYDRLDWLEDGLELIDYKSAKIVSEPDPVELNLQIGLYYLALEQRYQRSLKRLSLLYLRPSEKLSFDVTLDHQEQVKLMIGELALKLRTEQDWEPNLGEHCDRCAYARYCPGVCDQPEPLPHSAKPQLGLQLVLNLSSP